MPDAKILALVPSYWGVQPTPFSHFLVLAGACGRAEAEGRFLVRWMVAGPKMKITKARNIACSIAKNNGLSHVAMIDDDMLPTADVFDRLLERNVDIVAPLFFRSGGDHAPLLFKRAPDGSMNPILDYPKNALVECDGVGTGVIMIRTEILWQMREPWFWYDKEEKFTADLNFCQSATAAGIKIHCDTSFEVNQMGVPKPVGSKDFNRVLTEKQ
jgi:hypothetical protein